MKHLPILRGLSGLLAVKNAPARLLIALLSLASTSAIAAGAAGSAAPIPSPLSILELMRASIEIPADGLWAAEGAEKLSDEDWLLADQDAVQLIGAVSLLSRGGAGKNDRKWMENADWQAWVRDTEKTAIALRAAAKAHDATKLAASGDHLQEICAACHAKYRPAEPSDGIARYPFYPKRELAK
jgi:cytochrome c553